MFVESTQQLALPMKGEGEMQGMRFTVGWVLTGTIILCPSVSQADVPYPRAPDGVDVHRYGDYCRLKPGDPMPMNYAGSSVWKYTSEPSGNPSVDRNPRELFGVTGMGVDKAWEITTGRPDVVIAVIDSGIEWDQPDITEISDKFALNRGELPLPQDSAGNDHDRNGDGVFNVEDYAFDARVADWNGNGIRDPQDIIHAFADGVDDDGNGYVDDICGWDMVDDDNDPYDDVHYGHGTGESKDSCGEAYTDRSDGFPGTCPNCMILPVRVGLSFIAEDMTFGRAVIFAVDSGADVVQEALGTIDGSWLAQEAIHYAYARGVPIVASAADESSMHQNLPAAHEHTLTVNSVTKYEPGMEPESYLYLNGCTNYGGNIDATVSSSSCSSEAVGRGAGIAGLVISAAKNEMARGHLDRALTANEIEQIITMSADDIDFSGERSVRFPVFKTRRFPSGPGWDPYFGYGRVNAREAVRMVEEHDIPPEADLLSPAWFETLDPAATPEVEITGYAAATRSESYSYTVEYGRGARPGPLDWQTVFASGSLDTAREGPLCSWSIAPFQREVSRPPEGRDDFTFSIRLVVTDNEGRRAESRKTVYLHHDPDLKPGFPIQFGSSGEASVVTADLDGDNVEDMVVATSNGVIHALRADGSYLEGWPVNTDLLAFRYNESEAYRSGAIDEIVYESVGHGGVAVGDLDRDGNLEVVAASLYGKVYAWEHDGTRRPGFPTSLNPAYSLNPKFLPDDPQAGRDRFNRRLFGVSSAPVLEDMDRDGLLEIIIAALDNHVYVWDSQGRLLPGWPVLVVDPARFDVADEVTHKIVPAASGCPECTYYTGKIVSTPAVGDINDDGFPEVVVGTNEQYDERMNVSLSAGLLGIIGKLELMGGNARLHAIHHDGDDHEGGAFVAGWPVRIGLLMPEMLPYLGSGTPGSPVLADVDGDQGLEIAAFSTAGPVYLLRGDGSSFYGADADEDYHVMHTGPLEPGKDLPTIPAAGSALFADLTGDGRLACVAPSAGLRKMADILLPAEQMGNQNHISAWDARKGEMLQGFPVYMDDLQFIASPSVADLDGDGLPEIIGGSGGFLVRAYDVHGLSPDGWPKFTGKWVISTPAVGDIDGDGRVEIAVMTRSGDLYAWETAGDACDASSRQWWTFHHDPWHTGLYGKDAVPPGRPLGFRAQRKGEQLIFSWNATGDDGLCGQAKAYEIRGYDGDVEAHWKDAVVVTTYAEEQRPGSPIRVAARDPGFGHYGIRVEDDAGNPSRVVSVEVTDGSDAWPPDFMPESGDDDSDLWLVSTATPSGKAADRPVSLAANVLVLLLAPMGLVFLWKALRCRWTRSGAWLI
jgi:Subtilase family